MLLPSSQSEAEEVMQDGGQSQVSQQIRSEGSSEFSVLGVSSLMRKVAQMRILRQHQRIQPPNVFADATFHICPIFTSSLCFVFGDSGEILTSAESRHLRRLSPVSF